MSRNRSSYNIWQSILLIVFLSIIATIATAYLLSIIKNPLKLNYTQDTFKTDFLNSAMWIQAIAMIAAAVFSYILLKQIGLTADQLQIQRKLAAAEINKRLASKEFSKIRRFLYQKDVADFFKSIQENYRPNNSDYDISYSLFYNELERIKKDQKHQLTTIFDIEMLLNEYNHIGMLYRGGVFEKEMFTKKAIENAVIVFSILNNYIWLRRRANNSEKYALDYEEWIKEDLKEENDNQENKNSRISNFLKAFDY